MFAGMAVFENDGKYGLLSRRFDIAEKGAENAPGRTKGRGRRSNQNHAFPSTVTEAFS